MSKKILSILFTLFSVFILSGCNDAKQPLEITSADGLVTISLGEYRVIDYKKEKEYNLNETITFVVASENDFYNEVIKNSEYYYSNLEFKLEDFYYEGEYVKPHDYYSYGFLFKDNHFFQYYILNNKVKLKSLVCEFFDNNEAYYIFAPLYEALNYDVLYRKDENYPWYMEVRCPELSFDNLLTMFNYLDEDYCKIEDDVIYLKGIDYKKASDNCIEISEDYLVRIYKDNNDIIVGLAYE